MSDPDRRDFIPDERTEEEELLEQMHQWDGVIIACKDQIGDITTDLRQAQLQRTKAYIQYMAVRQNNDKFLKSFDPAIGSDPEDQIG